MAFRGRGRGRGFDGGYFKSEPFVLFPDIELPDAKTVPEETNLVIRNSKLIKYWKTSPYYIEENVSKKNQSIDIERFSDWSKPKNTLKRNSLNQVLQLQSHNFPKELIGDSRRGQRSAKKNAMESLLRMNILTMMKMIITLKMTTMMNLYISCSSIGMAESRRQDKISGVSSINIAYFRNLLTPFFYLCIFLYNNGRN